MIAGVAQFDAITSTQTHAIVTQYHLAQIAHMDHQIERVMTAVPDDTVVVFIPDQGFQLGHNRHFGKLTLVDETALVPFSITDPTGTLSAGTQDDVVSTLDLAQTLTKLAGVEPFNDWDGTSLDVIDDRPVETYDTSGRLTVDGDWRIIRSDPLGSETPCETTVVNWKPDDPLQRTNLGAAVLDDGTCA